MRLSDGSPAEDVRIESWKEIASFFGRDQRTVKRWEKTRNLPIHRLPGAKSGVFAYTRELTDWLNSASRENLAEDEEAEAFEAAELDAAAEMQAFGGDPDFHTGNGFHREDEAGQSAESAQIAPRAESAQAAQGDREAGEAALSAANSTAAAATSAPRHRIRWVLAAGVAAALILVVLYSFSGAVRAKVDSVSRPAQAHRKLPPSPAEEQYLQGRYYLSHRTNATLRQAVDSFTQAVIRDPDYAPAYAGLAESYELMPQYTSMPKSQAFPMALAAARKAVALDDSLAVAHRALGFALVYGQMRPGDGFREYQRAIELDPQDSEAHSWYATSLLLVGHAPEARIEIEKAKELDPTSRAILANEALILFTLGDHDGSIARLKELENAEPDYLGPSGYLEGIYFALKDYPSYIEQLKHSAGITKDPLRTNLAAAAEKGWKQGGERGLLEQMALVYRPAVESGTASAFDLAGVYVRLGRRQEADQYLRQAFASNDYSVIQLLNGDFEAGMHGDAAFEKLKQQIRARVGNYSTPIL